MIRHRQLSQDELSRGQVNEAVEVDPLPDATAPSSVLSMDGSGSQESLDGRQTLPRMKSYDAVVFDVLRVAPEDFASQITLMDDPVFKAIQPDELTSCAWSSKEKLTKAPNVVAFTRRFNHVNFWVQKEILSAQALKSRAEHMALFIKIARRLFELNNLHAVMAIISALQSAPIFRLSRTWAVLSKRDKASYEKMADLFSENSNRLRLREHMSVVKMPCIPYLGLYLTDLTYIDVAHPHSGGLESEPRRQQMNNILRVLAEFQKSSYEHLPVLEHVQNYLKSVRYIEELQKFIEDDNYKLSLKLEPLPQSPQQFSTISSSKEDLTTPDSSCITPCKQHLQTPGGTAFVVVHRKANSLSHDFKYHSQHRHKSSSLPSRTTAPYVQGQRHLLDDSVLEESPCTSSEGSTTGVGDCRDETESDQDWPGKTPGGLEDLPADLYKAQYITEGCLKRKTLLKNGKKPTVSTWSRYWVSLWGTSLLYFPARSLRGVDRESFRSEPSKMVSIVGWMAVMSDNSLQPDAFILTDPVKGNSYKFRANAPVRALEWCRHVDKASKTVHTKPQDNLISFE